MTETPVSAYADGVRLASGGFEYKYGHLAGWSQPSYSFSFALVIWREKLEILASTSDSRYF